MSTDETEMNLRSYYYGFSKSGHRAIDRVLSAVACAGKSFHHTEDWHEVATPREYHEGCAPIDWIQNAADDAARYLAKLESERGRLRAALEKLSQTILVCGGHEEQCGWLCDDKCDCIGPIITEALK